MFRFGDKIAIIIPIYNVEKYIFDCIDSVIVQTYTNLEIILVDDGSPDKCPQICDEYAEKDTRIIVLHKENGGLSDARNYGVENAKSDYVMFMDSDDYVDENYVLSLAQLMIKYDADISCSPLIFEYENGEKKNRLPFEEKCIDAPEAQQMVMRAQYGIGVTACSKLFPKTLLLANPFPKGQIHEDIAVAWDLFAKVKLVAITPLATYHYIQRNESITHKKINFDALFWILNHLNTLVSENDLDEKQKAACVHRMYELVNEICRVVNVKNSRDNIIKTQNIIKPYLKMVLSDPLNRKKEKIKYRMLAMSYSSFGLYCTMKSLLR